MVAKVATYLFFGTLVESLVEYFVSEWTGKRWTKYAAAVVGVALSLLYNLDLVAELTELSIPIAGCVLTGLVIGRGANYVSDLIDLVRAYTDRAG